LIKAKQPLIWITKTLTGGDTNTRIGIADHIGGYIRYLEVPNDFCTDQDIKKRLANSGLISANKCIWPDVLIGPSLHIPYMQEIKRMSKGKAIVVALRTPVRDVPIQATQEQISDTDVIISYPYHDNSGIPNLFVCDFLPNRVTTEKIIAARSVWRKQLLNGINERPIISVLVGGDIGDKRKIFSNSVAEEFGRLINKSAIDKGGSLLISMSARTPAHANEIIRSKIKVPYYLYDPKMSLGENPYLGILANADYIIVTADSASMCNEAVSSGKPVYIYYDESIVEEIHTKIVYNLVENGCARILSDSKKVEAFSYTPVNSAKNVAQHIQKFLGERST
jgi:mitochondrial fission protein ELM1